MNAPLLGYDQRAHEAAGARGQPAPTDGCLETPAEALDALAARRPDALTWFTRYLRRRDRVLGEMAAEEFGFVLESLAADFRTEAAADPTSPHANGLARAAVVVSDTAAAIQAGG